MDAAEQLLSALRRAPSKGGGSPSSIPAMVQAWKGMGDSMMKSLMDSFSDIESREENIRVVSEFLEMRLRDLEEKETEFTVLQEGKSEELKLRLLDLEEKEREFTVLREGKSEELRLRLRDLEEKEGEFTAFREGKSEELRLRLRDLEEKERKFTMFREGKSEELRLREENLDEQLKLVGEHIDKLEAEAEVLRVKEIEKMTAIEKREKELDSVSSWLLEKRLNEVDKREKELEALYDGKFKELGLKEEVLGKEKELEALYDGKFKELRLKEEVLGKEKEKFAEEVNLTNEKLREKQKLGCGLIERLEMTLEMLGGMKVLMDEKFKEIESKATMAHESLTSRLNEADLIRESLEKRFKELEDIEKELSFSQLDKSRLESKEGQLRTVSIDKDKVNSSEEEATEKQKVGLQLLENKPEEKKQELGSKHETLVSCTKEHDYERQGLEAGKCREKSPTSVRDSPRNIAKENLASSKLDHQSQRHFVGTDARPVADKGQHVCRPRDVDLKQSTLSDTTGARLTIKREKSEDLRDTLQTDQKALEMLINDPEKDLELMGDNVYKILSLSSDPAKLVLDTVDALRSGKIDTECRVNRSTILLLDQLTKVSLKIQPCVTEAATKLALEWKSKMSTTGENPMEALGFLRFLAAYNLSSHFKKIKLFSLLKLASQHKQTPDLCHALGLTDKIPGLINALINEKRFLLASIYVNTYKLEHQFPQASLLNNYVLQSKMSANAKRRIESNSFEARDNAIASEIADLRLAIEHIIKYGLETAYSTNALTSKIKQLEVSRANLKNGGPQPTTGGGIGERLGGLGKKARRRALKASREYGAAPTLAPQMPCYGSNGWSPPVWRESQPVDAPPGFPYQWGGCVNIVPMQQPIMAPHPYKKRKKNTWHNNNYGQQFCN